MTQTNHTASGWRIARRALLAAGLAAALAGTASAASRPANLDRSLDRATDRGVFRIQIRSVADPIPLFRIHPWRLHLAAPDGAAISGATIAIDGGMPEHGHGLPTAPRAAPAETPGDYLISGMKFSMPGWWVLKLQVRAPDGRSDTVTFNLVL